MAQKDSAHNDLDLDGDNIVSDFELATSEVLYVFTLAVFLPIFPDARIKALSDLFGLFYIGQAGVVGAYMGMTAYMAKGK